MNDPRDFLPAKYKKNQAAEDLSESLVSKDNSLNKIDSPWSDLAKKSEVPEYRSSNIYNAIDSKTDDASTDLISRLDDNVEPIKNTPNFTPKNKSSKKLAGLLVVFFLVVGVFSSYLLSQQSQDNRQQASGSCDPIDPYCDEDGKCEAGHEQYTIPGTGKSVCVISTLHGGGGDDVTCGAGEKLVKNAISDAGMCILCSDYPYVCAASTTAPDNSTLTPPPADENRFGWCAVCSDPSTPSEADWLNTDIQISGTYTFGGKRYIIDLPATHEAATLYATNWPKINDYISDPDGQGDVEVAPFLLCGSGDTYNTIDCGYDAESCTVIDIIEETPGLARCYLSQTAYEEQLALGHTWVPDGTGCGDTINDTIDCNEYHFTTCLNTGSGVNGYGCDSNNNNNQEDENPTQSPTASPVLLSCGQFDCETDSDCSTGLVCQSVTADDQEKKICAKTEYSTACAANPTATSCCQSPESPICSNIEMLDSTGEAMTADDDENLKNGDQIKFRTTAGNVSDIDVTYEFRIWAPNMSTWTDITNSDASSGAANVSAAYTIISSGHHVAQSRICISGECQAWETVTGAPSDINQ